MSRRVSTVSDMCSPLCAVRKPHRQADRVRTCAAVTKVRLCQRCVTRRCVTSRTRRRGDMGKNGKHKKDADSGNDELPKGFDIDDPKLPAAIENAALGS